ATRIVPPLDQFKALMADLERAPWLEMTMTARGASCSSVLTRFLTLAEEKHEPDQQANADNEP
ncbi:MAG: hypothetical protein E5W13_27440, partial [Mesorhizobium sp.]